MKSLRQLLRRNQPQTGASQNSRRAGKRSYGDVKRRLTTQALEQRQLLAGDVLDAHNGWNRFDVNQDWKISPSDALSVINYLATDNAQGEETQQDVFRGRKVDVNGDGQITPSDALGVINAIARGEAANTPVVELLLSARDTSDQELAAASSGTIEVGVGIENSFLLEVAYDDRRTFGADTGVFSIYPDLGFSRGGLLQPVLRESQQLVIKKEIFGSTSGFMTIGLEGSTQTVDITLEQLGNNARGAISDALVQLGYNASDFEITQPSFLRGTDSSTPPFDLGFIIRYTGSQFGNQDLPDLVVTESFDNEVPIEFSATPPLLPDGSPNNAAIPLSLDVRSRTLNNNEPFYTTLNRGTFDAVNGFTDIGGTGPLNPQGVRDATDDGLMPPIFDAFSIEVFVTQPIAVNNPLVIDVNPGAGVDPLTMYNIDDPVPEDQILTNAGARVTISTGAAAVNNPPVVDADLDKLFNEDGAVATVDLLEGASDPDGDTLNVSGTLSFTGGDASGVTQNGNTLTVDPSVYNSLAFDESVVLNSTYSISDGKGGSVSQTITLTIDGVNDPPVVTGNISETRSENALQFTVDLLRNASDVDGDALDATNITQVGSDDTSGITVDDQNNQLIVDPSAYAALNDGESVTVTYNYTVTDKNGGDVNNVEVSITILGDTPNRNPVVDGPVTLAVNEDDADTSVDLLQGASDPDAGDVLSIGTDSFTLRSGDDSGITRNGTTLNVSPNAYNSLPAGTTETVIFDYDIVDQENGIVAQSATVTIEGRNDAPTVGAAVTASFTEDDATASVDLLAGAADPDTGDSISVDGLTLVSGDASGITMGTDSLSIDPSAYDNLAVGEQVTVVYTYNVVDLNQGSTPQSATITITGVNDAPTVGEPVAATFSEDDAAPATVDLLGGAADPDTNDTLAIANVVTASGDSAPMTIGTDGTVTFDPNAYNSLADGESEVVVLNYDVVDGNSGSVAQSATITINGANDAPVVSGAISLTASEQDAPTSLNLLDNASDPDTTDTLSVADLTTSGDDSGVVVNGSSVSITPNAYDGLAAGESAVITLTYNVTDGEVSVPTSATITITGVDDDPVVEGPIDVTFSERDAATTVSLLQGATDPNGDPLNVINAQITSGDSRGVTVDVANSQLLINPRAYADLEDGETAVVVVNYDITDDEGHTVAQTATVTINGRTIIGSTVHGELFIDHVENGEDVQKGADPIRNGERDSDEQALGGVVVRLMKVTPEGEMEVARVMTNNDGQYMFEEVEGGTYYVEYDVPESVRYTGSARGQIVVDEFGGEDITGPSLGAIGLVGVQQRLDLLAKTYIDRGIIDTGDYSGGLSGGSAHMNADGTQALFVAAVGFDTQGVGIDAQYAEVVLNEARDAALLTILDSNGQVHSARLEWGEFVVAGQGEGVRFFGRLEDMNFSGTTEELLEAEFSQYRNAIDRAMAAGV